MQVCDTIVGKDNEQYPTGNAQFTTGQRVAMRDSAVPQSVFHCSLRIACWILLISSPRKQHRTRRSCHARKLFAKVPECPQLIDNIFVQRNARQQQQQTLGTLVAAGANQNDGREQPERRSLDEQLDEAASPLKIGAGLVLASG